MSVKLSNNNDIIANSIAVLTENDYIDIMNIIQNVSNLIAQVVGRPPSTLHTLQKIADSINNDPFIYQTLVALINAKAPTTDVYNKQYIDNLIADYYTQSQVDVLFSNLIDSTPTTLNTLNELATALNDDANYASTIQNKLATEANAVAVCNKLYIDTLISKLF